MCLHKMASQTQKIVYKLVLTGGPCGGKTTGQSRLCTFFENLGWKVFRVPETATVLLSGGVKFADLTPDEAMKFQENLLKTMVQIENTFFELGRTCQRNCMIICDRGAMDASAFISKEKWEAMLNANSWNSVELRDNRYNHIVHMVSAANGAEDFYSTEDHACRSEGVELARELDYNAAAAWIGHPYFDVIDNSTDFDKKMNRLIACVCQKIGIETGDRLNVNSKKRKFLVKGPLPPDTEFPAFQDFDVVHNYLQSDLRKAQVRLRKRGQKGHWSYIHTLRKFHPNGQSVEVRTQLSHRDYLNMLPQRDDAHFTIFKKRRCFIFNNQYYQLDVYRQPTHPRCRGLFLLETYSATYDHDSLLDTLPKFLTIEREVTGDPAFSMYNLSLKEDWKTSKRYYAGQKDAGTECHGQAKCSMNGHADKLYGHACKVNGHGGKLNGHGGAKDNGCGEKVNGHCEGVHGHRESGPGARLADGVHGHRESGPGARLADVVHGHRESGPGARLADGVHGHRETGHGARLADGVHGHRESGPGARLADVVHGHRESGPGARLADGVHGHRETGHGARLADGVHGHRESGPGARLADVVHGHRESGPGARLADGVHGHRETGHGARLADGVHGHRESGPGARLADVVHGHRESGPGARLADGVHGHRETGHGARLADGVHGHRESGLGARLADGEHGHREPGLGERLANGVHIDAALGGHSMDLPSPKIPKKVALKI